MREGLIYSTILLNIGILLAHCKKALHGNGKRYADVLPYLPEGWKVRSAPETAVRRAYWKSVNKSRPNRAALPFCNRFVIGQNSVPFLKNGTEHFEKENHRKHIVYGGFGPSAEIRTQGLLNPIQARYQTSPQWFTFLLVLCGDTPLYVVILELL